MGSYTWGHAEVLEQADRAVSKTAEGNLVWVRVPPSAPEGEGHRPSPLPLYQLLLDDVKIGRWFTPGRKSQSPRFGWLVSLSCLFRMPTHPVVCRGEH